MYVGSDYELLNSSITCEQNTFSTCVAVSIIDDAFLENTESFTLSLIPLSERVNVANMVSTVFITDNDGVLVERMVWCFNSIGWGD